MIKKIGVLVLLFFLLFPIGQAIAESEKASAGSEKVEIVVFVRNGCIHCINEEKFLEDLQKSRNDIAIHKYRLENEAEKKVWEEFTTRTNTSKVTPITVIGVNYIIGFDADETTGKEIISLVEKVKKNNVKTELAKITKDSIQGSSSTCDEEGLVACEATPVVSVNLPLIGKIDSQKYPLLILSALLGFFDGFNPCAMWVLITFLIILIEVGNRKKMFLFAGTFIAAEAIMYSLILTVWYKTWDFVHLDNIVTPLVGVVAIAGGIFFLREWHKKELECKVTDLKQQQKTKQKIQSLATNKFTFFTFLAILGIAFSVNIIEFACSIGIPQAFTKILELNNLSFLQSAFFIGIYILFYMIDDFIVFGIALYGADKFELTTKYSKLSNLIGGIVMILLGLLLIIKPNFLLF